MTRHDYVAAADDALEAAHDEPTSLGAFVDRVFADPSVAAHASKYLLEAIEAAGTRTVVEEGERRERYRFFDDPHNGGEHAVLGNTDTLNDFVDDLRAVAANQGKAEQILWFAGPTATGKSELKRCLVNGLRAYSKTPEGRRYTVEWNVSGAGTDATLTYGGADPEREDDWYRSPVQSNPLSVFPRAVRKRLVADLPDDETVPVRVEADLDPFSREAYETLERRYRREGRSDVFAAATDPAHLRVTNYVMDVGTGIGVLHAEDAGTATERLVGSWLGELLAEVGSRGRKNPQAFSYDGVLSQGNGGLTVVEDAAQHADLLRKLLNVPDERSVKLDTGIEMDLDTQLVVISNLDLEAQLNQHADRQGRDPLKALKRRLTKHEFDYLTTYSLEAQLLHRELGQATEVWRPADYEELTDLVRAPLSIRVDDHDGPRRRELAPHAVEAAALYSVVSRLDDSDLPEEFDLVDKAVLFDRGWLRDGDDRVSIADLDLNRDGTDGTNGIPVTYTRDVLADLLHEASDRHHPEFDVERVVMPRDVLDAMVAGFAGAPVFSPTERSKFESRVVAVKDHVFERQETAVLDAMLREDRLSPAAVADYVEQVYAWAVDEPVRDDAGEEVVPDPLQLKVFETEHLGFAAGDYDGTDPDEAVRTFRETKVVTPLNRQAWESRTEDFRVDDVDFNEIPALNAVVEANEWEDVRRTHPDFDPAQWADPPADTETAALKGRTVANMVEHAGYSRASAELTSRHVVEQVSYGWD